MASRFIRIAIVHVLLLATICLSGFGQVSSLGINYGQLGNNLPPPEKSVVLLKALRISKTRIYDTNPQILTAFANSGIEIIVTVENNMLATLSDPQQAIQWVGTHIKPYYPATKITGIAVGNEVFTVDGDTSLMASVVPAMVSIHQALVQFGMDSSISVSTPSSLAVLSESYPPSSGSFRPELAPYMTQFLQFLTSTRSPFWINAYPYFAYKDSSSKISLDYALANPNSGMIDPYTKLRYDNMLYAQVDAVIFAMTRLGYGGLEVRVSETGWPSSGDANEIGATIGNAEAYNRNMFKRQLIGHEGTPLRPNNRLEVYLFALYNEDMKPGPTSERNYGLYQPDGNLCYDVGVSTLSSTSSTTTATSSTSSATISLTSSASKAISKGYHQSLIFWTFVLLLAFEVCMGRHF